MQQYVERTYRNKITRGHLTSFQITVKETDLYISADKDLSDEALASVFDCRKYIEDYIRHRPAFLTSLEPIEDDDFAPFIIREMLRASWVTGVGPMASVAGTIAQYVGNDLLRYSKNVIVENGGDIFMSLDSGDTNVVIFAGESLLSYKISLKFSSDDTPIGICTSSGTVGHSISFGRADAVCVTSKSASVADAAATSIGNYIRGGEDIKETLAVASKIEGVLGTLIILNDKLGAWGAIELG